MNPEKKVHVVSHSHWDREWYFTTCDSLVLMDKTFTDVLKELERNQAANFCLDGQISIAEEYLELHPEKKAAMERLVKEKRLFTGPWYTQTDTKMVSLESIVSNLYYGIWRSKDLFGDYMKCGYLPDTFGFSNQVPMILSQFGIDNFIFWRGTDYEAQGIGPYFTWEGQDGSRVSAINLFGSYGMAKGLSSSEKFIRNVYHPLMESYDRITDGPDILMPVGNDQNHIVKDLDKKIAEIGPELVIDSYEGFAEAVKPHLKGLYKGELNEGKYSRVHKSAGSIRISLKKRNYEGETLLAKEVGPLNAMAGEEGMALSRNLIQKAWKLLFEGQAHDSIVGCVSDSVTLDILNRGKKVLEIGKAAANYIKKEFAASIGLKEDEILIFNTEPFPFEGYKEIEIVTRQERVRLLGAVSCSTLSTVKYTGCQNALVETPEGNHYEKEPDYYIHKLLVKVALPSFGYKVFSFCGEEGRETENHQVTENSLSAGHLPEDAPSIESGVSIEGGRYRIAYEEGSITLYDGQRVIRDFISLTDIGNDGDTYDFSPIEKEVESRLSIHGARVTRLENVQMMEIDCSASLPYDLSDRKALLEKEREDEKQGQVCRKECGAKITVSLRDDDMVYVSVWFDNQVLSHRVRLKVRGMSPKPAVGQTIAAVPGGTVIRNLSQGIPEDWASRFVEYPIDIEMNTGFAGFYGKGEQLVVFNKGSREYQAADGSIYMTLLASCPELGKPDLLYRPGRASGDTTKKGHVRIYTPMAQELGENRWEFAVGFMEPDDLLLYKTLERFESPSVFYQSQDINLFYERIDNKIQLHADEIRPLEREKSYLNLDKDLVVSGIYHSLYDGSLYARVMSLKDKGKNELSCSHDIRISNLLEQGEEELLKAYRLYALQIGKRRG